MTVIIAGTMDLENPGQMKEMLLAARPHIEGALAEEGCIAYSWTEDHLTSGRLQIYEEWTTSEALSAHLASHWYRDMGAHLAQYPRKPLAVQTRSREILLPVLFFPVVLPVLVGAVEATKQAIGGQTIVGLGHWLPLLGAFDALFLVICPWVFSIVVEE